MPARDEHDMTQIYESTDWYQSRSEPEAIWIGTLEERLSGIGPDTRGRLTYVLVGDLGRLNIYAANADKLLKRFLRRSVRIRGKLVDLTDEGHGKELWPASIEGDNSADEC